MKTKHTPGPWKWQGTMGSPKIKAYLSAPAGTVLADCNGLDISDADAALISAAPDLLASCRALLRLHYDQGTATLQGLEAVNQAEEALRKAASPAKHGRE